MKAITNIVVRRVCTEMDRFSSSQVSTEAGRFIRQQPHVVHFIDEFTDGFSRQSQQLGMYLAYWIWKVYSRGWRSRLPALTWEFCYQSLARERTNLGNYKLSRRFSQPVVQDYLVSFLNEGSHLGNAERGSLLIILKSVASAFEESAEKI